MIEDKIDKNLEDQTKPPSKFRLSMKIDFKQVVIMFSIAVLILSVPVLFELQSRTSENIFNILINNLKKLVSVNKIENQLFLSSNLLSLRFDISVLLNNTELTAFVAVGLLIIASIISIALSRHKKK